MNQEKGLKIIALAVALNMLFGATAPVATVALAAVKTPTIKETAVTAKTQLETGVKKMKLTITAYSSTPDQTYDTPFTTAANTTVRDGIVATNILPLHTKVKIPALFGEKVFVVEDRMNRRYQTRMDIWFADRATATKFGKKYAEIVVL